MKETSSALANIYRFLERDDLGVSSSSGEFKLPFNIEPNRFFEFARSDFNENTQRSRVNALSNIKRAIDCRMDSLLIAFGLYSKSKHNNWNFPKKAEVLIKAGVVAPKILTKINKERNQLEHDFQIPKRGEIEDFLDVAQLFLSSTDVLADMKPDDITFEATKMRPRRRFEGIILHPHLTLKLDEKKGLFEIGLVKDPKPPQVSSNLEVSMADVDNYFKILGYWVRAIRKGH